MNAAVGILIPFLGTSAGAACVFFLKKSLNTKVEKCLLGFASGIMVAASVWSLLIPSLEMGAGSGNGFLACVPAVGGFLLGMLFLAWIGRMAAKLERQNQSLLYVAVTLHNIPEGLAVGVAFAGAVSAGDEFGMAGAFALAIGIAIQNFPEGAIISMPMRAAGSSRKKAFLAGTASGIVEPLASAVTLCFAGTIERLLPWCLSFAAGAMIFVVIEELLPETVKGMRTRAGTAGFAAGFLMMMVLDVVFG
ncbi:MAG: ZIP family metal transporter [Eubacteriales bacterium]|nr:ZIP family metal transporter [Eubacteriales bacterium]